MLNYYLDTESLRQAEQVLGRFPKKLEQAKRRALQRAMQSMRTTISRMVPKYYYVKIGVVKQSISVYQSGATTGEIKITGRRRSLANFYMTPKKAPVKNGLKVAVRRDTGIKRISKGFLLPGAGKYLPFIRTGKARKDIKHLVSPAIPQMIEFNDDITQAIGDAGQEAFEKNLTFWVNNILSKG